MSLYLGENKIADNTCSRNIGEIVASTIPLSDAGLHLLDGAIISNVGSYAKFVNYIAGLVSNYPDLFETEANWQSSVSTYGVCGKFVYDSTNNTVRLPKITGFTEGTTDITALGDLIEAGLPNITGNFSMKEHHGSLIGMASEGGAIYGSDYGNYTRPDGGADKGSGANRTVNISASRSSSIYGNSTTVQPQSIKVLYYIVIASSITNELNLDVADLERSKANTDLSNLTSTGKNIANWANNVTNCITEIPQDIKLELNNGKLTLKAGSKVYVPNGFESDGATPKFNEVVISNNMNMNGGAANGQEFVYLVANGSALYHYLDNSSGTDWTATSKYQCRYNTTDNMIKNTNDTGSTWLSQVSFPIAKVTLSSGTVTSIDQVFNGFGYIGSTVFALPGVKGLIPNGRNADGTLKNIEFSLSQVQTLTITSAWGTGNEGWWLNGINLNIHRTIGATYFQDSKPSTSHHDAYWFSPKENILRQTTDIGATWTQIQGSYSFNISFTSGKVTSLTPKTAFHAVDYNDSSTISGWSMPSSRYIGLTLGASGSTYTAPANGYFYLNKIAGSDFYYAQIATIKNEEEFRKIFVSEYRTSLCTFLYPVAKGDVVRITYNATGTTNAFRFYYAEGEN